MRRWLRRRRWWLGGYFCETGEREILRQISELRTVHTAEMLALQTAQAEVVRLMKLNERSRVECERHRADLERRLDAVNTDRLALVRQLTQTEEPPALRLMGDG